MREIKFRYRIRNRKYGKIHKIIIDINVLESGRQSEYFNILDYEILSRDEYTGLNAKNGEIYEEDILEYEQTKRRFIIYWDEDNLQWAARFIKNKPRYTDGLWRYEFNKAKIIGNKWENPELGEAK